MRNCSQDLPSAHCKRRCRPCRTHRDQSILQRMPARRFWLMALSQLRSRRGPKNKGKVRKDRDQPASWSQGETLCAAAAETWGRPSLMRPRPESIGSVPGAWI
mmetsp:Transcript_12887/g.24312  ORF Transcript_12887/g.24312 Transcript_12887/m.24312 type:complete len:103 (-) Transcript_12887:36-344(-)